MPDFEVLVQVVTLPLEGQPISLFWGLYGDPAASGQAQAKFTIKNTGEQFFASNWYPVPMDGPGPNGSQSE